MSPATHGAPLATIRLPRIAPIVMPAEAAPCRRARIGLPRRRSIRAPSAFMVTSTTPPRRPEPTRIPPTVSAVFAFRSAHKAVPKPIAPTTRTFRTPKAWASAPAADIAIR